MQYLCHRWLLGWQTPYIGIRKDKMDLFFNKNNEKNPSDNTKSVKEKKSVFMV